MEGIYDMLTAVDKVGKITDLPMEKTDGHDVAHLPFAGGMEIKVRHLSYRNPVYDKDALIDVSLDIPAGSLICFSGMHDCGKFTMAHLISGLLHDYEGSIMINGMPMREMQPMAYRNLVDTNAFEREIFEGTFRDNVLVGSHGVALEQLRWALETSGLDEYVAGLEKGLDTHILPEGRELPHYVRARMLICRMLIRKPSLLVLTDYFGDYTVQERRFLMRTLLDTQLKNSTKIAVTNSPALMSAADRIFMFRDHYLVFEGVWEDFQKTSAYRELIAENLQET
jgi:ABC-type multidrug transport system fused ATPase/permease subunit